MHSYLFLIELITRICRPTHMVCTRKKSRSGFSPVRQDTSGIFWCPVLSGLDTHMSSPVEAYLLQTDIQKPKPSVPRILKGIFINQVASDFSTLLTKLKKGKLMNVIESGTCGSLFNFASFFLSLIFS